MFKLTEFQQSVTREQLIEICKKMHFTLTDDQLSHLKFYYMSTWVCVEFTVKDYGLVSFGINNHDQSILSVTITKEEAKAALTTGQVSIRVWRFTSDEISKRQKQAEELVSEAFSLPSVDEFYEHY